MQPQRIHPAKRGNAKARTRTWKQHPFPGHGRCTSRVRTSGPSARLSSSAPPLRGPCSLFKTTESSTHAALRASASASFNYNYERKKPKQLTRGLARSRRAEQERNQRERNREAGAKHSSRMHKAREALEVEMAPNDGWGGSARDASRLQKAFISWTDPSTGRTTLVRRTSAFGKLEESVCGVTQKQSIARLSTSVKKKPGHTFLDVHASSLSETQWAMHVDKDPHNTWLLSRNPHCRATQKKHKKR
jgi:hypothetical protein